MVVEQTPLQTTRVGKVFVEESINFDGRDLTDYFSDLRILSSASIMRKAKSYQFGNLREDCCADRATMRGDPLISSIDRGAKSEMIYIYKYIC